MRKLIVILAAAALLIVGLGWYISEVLVEPRLKHLEQDGDLADASQMEAYNPNYVGGDINAGVQDLRQHFTRPAVRVVPYRTPAKGIFICSSSTPPGGGVHGMCGYHAAQSALRHIDRVEPGPLTT